MKKAFTLSEVLVTLGIIGVVSAMTVPTLMQNYQRKSYVTQLNKVYNLLSQSLMIFQNNKNALNLKEAGLVKGAEAEFLKGNFKIVKDCGFDAANSGCFASSYSTMTSNDSITPPATSYYKVVLSNGASVALILNEASYKVYDNSIGQIIVDINGNSGPNIAGRDFWGMKIYSDGVIDDTGMSPECRKTNSCENGDINSEREWWFSESCQNSGGAGSPPFGCLGKIINDNWEMTY